MKKKKNNKEREKKKKAYVFQFDQYSVAQKGKELECQMNLAPHSFFPFLVFPSFLINIIKTTA
jgi:hypothetical protein